MRSGRQAVVSSEPRLLELLGPGVGCRGAVIGLGSCVIISDMISK